jgi:membrane dipeptidase
MSSLHESAIVFDGLVVSKWGRAVFEHMHQGGVTAANCTVSVWEGFRDTMINIARWKHWFVEHGDIIMQCRSVDDIRAAKVAGKVGIVFGWQNSAAIEDRIDLLPLFRELGVRFVQLTYNTQNFAASGCWEPADGGLSGFGHRLVAEMNRLGIVVDLSHVGARSAAEAIKASAKPCAYTHICPAGLFEHPRNKTDAQLREIVDAGGFVGVAAYPPFMRSGAATTLDDVIDLFDHVIDRCGEANVGIGTDFTEGQDDAFFEWVRRDKGHGAQLVPSRGVPPAVKDFASLADYPALTRAMQARGWSERRITGVLGANWLGFLERVW